jgi:molybdopterin synthase catalytic subunit
VDDVSSGIRLVYEPIRVEEIVSGLTRPQIGAVATFVGVVRGESGGNAVERLEYEAYGAMAREALERIVGEIHARFPTIADVAIVHRLGALAVGETAVVVAVAAGHREETFPALALAVDRLKETVPIWKKEIWEDGAAWKENT